MEGAKTIGIVGGGQLGRMLTLAAKPLGFHVMVVDPTPNCPAAQVGADEITAAYDDESAIQKLADKVDYVTIEFEHVAVSVLEKLAALGKPVSPSPATIAMIKDKFAQKQFLDDKDIPVAPFVEITDGASAERALKAYGGKMLLKTRHGAFDGRGNRLVRSRAELERALQAFEGRKLYAEAYVPFRKELAVVLARSSNGELALYPLAETIHQNNICSEVLVPARVTSAVVRSARHLARQVAEHLGGAGVFCIELFLTADNQLLVNEIAPRVHNSGHFSLDACRTSQFEQHVRAVTGLPLGDTSLSAPAAAMINILGERNGETVIKGLSEALAVPATSVHLYGKSPTKVDRKMGHITAAADNVTIARKRARQARTALEI